MGTHATRIVPVRLYLLVIVQQATAKAQSSICHRATRLQDFIPPKQLQFKMEKMAGIRALTECLHPSNIMRHDNDHFWSSRLRLMWMLAGLNGRHILGFERNVTRE